MNACVFIRKEHEDGACFAVVGLARSFRSGVPEDRVLRGRGSGEMVRKF